MKPQITQHTPSSPRQQRGAALLILLTLVLLAASYTLLKKLNTNPSDLVRGGDTAAVLGQAKAALIGFALNSNARPGELPCPDSSLPGSNASGDSTPGCAGGTTFRLPWRTLGLPDLRDSSGERLWYAVDPAFVGTAALNSETPATQTIDGGATRYAAVIVAPGESLDGQSRSGGQQNNLLRYLEADNANNDTVFLTASAGDFNDQVLGITRDELMQAVERRVLKEVANKLNTYYIANNYFPNPAPLGSPDCLASSGMVPLNIATACSLQADWGGGPAALPAWFNDNNWDQIIWYVVSTDCVESVRSCGANLLTVRSTPVPNSDKRALLIAAGAPLTGQNRQPVVTDVSQLLDSTENTNGDTIFKFLPIDAVSNDQIRVVAP